MLQLFYLAMSDNGVGDEAIGEFSKLMDGMVSSSDILNNTVHLAVVIDNITSSITLIKSVVIHSRSPVHFHVIVFDNVLYTVIHKLMDTWSFKDIEYTLYPSFDMLLVSWIPSNVEFDVNDLLKLHLPIVLPRSLDRIILLDDKLIMTGDVWAVWKLFSLQLEIRSKPIAISRSNTVNHNCFDGAITFYNLNLIWSIEWNEILRKAMLRKTRLTGVLIQSETILNTVISELPSIHSFLPCDLVDSCLKSTCEIDNIPKSFFISRKQFKKDCKEGHLAHYYKVEEYINEYDSVSLRRTPSQSGRIDPKHKKMSKSKICRTLKEDSVIQYITRLFYIGRFYQPDTDFDTTIVSQLSINRLSIFSRLLYQWSGPVSITMYGNDSQVWEVMKYVTRFSLYKRRNLAIHFVLQEGMFYPVNYLRNVALVNVRTKYVFLDDVDFLPSYGLHSRLQSYCKQLLNTDVRRALVIPAFETSVHNFSYPSNKFDLLKLMNLTHVTTYCPSCKHQTHAPTRYKVWYTSSYPYEIDWAYHYEPYIVVKSDVIQYNRRFMGYGWNKVSQIAELKAQGYQFIVIPDHFIIHMPHKTSKDKAVWNMGAFKFCINRIWKRFVSELKHKYGMHSLTETHESYSIFKDVT